ncbi:hypothetical protein ACJJTC_016201 [Scirpophaga incertulas]
MDSSDKFPEENMPEESDSERTSIRNELSSLSFEELQKLKQRIGAKVYKEALFGIKSKNAENKPKVFKRENKNRPREMSSKKPVSCLLDAPKVKKKEIRDPRFDPLCGEFDKKEFAQNYNFLSELHVKDIKTIRAELKETTDPERQIKLRRLLQRLNDKLKSQKKQKVQREVNDNIKKQQKQDIAEGKHPHFKNKSEMRVEALVQQYEALKNEGSGRIQRHLKRRQQKLKKRSHKAPTGVES